MSGYPPIPDDELKALFPLTRPTPVKAGAFELGLVLGGTVSAGAYTGGVLDYFIEALDAWTCAKDQGDPLAPPHEVVITTIAGASGGAINGAILLRSASYEFPHGASADNPFYQSWTAGVDLMKLLSDGPEHGVSGLSSLLNCGAIDDQAKATIAYKGRPLGGTTSPKSRSYLADPLRLTMMVGNLTGIPYSISMSGQTGLTHDLVAHSNFARFALHVPGGVDNAPNSRPDEFALAGTSEINWNFLEKAALATSAFPVAFRARPFSHPMVSLAYRAVAVPGDDGVATVVQLRPLWDLLAAGEPDAGSYTSLNVDGGTINNEPLDIVHQALAGLAGRNPRDASEANRASILIDPFSDPETLGPREGGLGKVLLGLVLGLVFQARFKPVDAALAMSENVYSRFLVAPVGPGPDGQTRIGMKAIASGGLGGFLGFVHRGFLAYDFALGRYNAHAFLTRHLAFPKDANNPLFAGWTDAMRKEYGVDDTGFYPLIPVMKALRDNPPQLLPWPSLKEMPDFSDAVTKRLQYVYETLKAAAAPASFWKKLLMSAYLAIGWRLYLRSALREAILKTLKDGVTQQGLL